MGGMITLAYGVVCYFVFFLTFLYAIGFVGDFVVPTSLDRGTMGPTGLAWSVDVALLVLFAVQHSGMARRGFKQWLTGWRRQRPNAAPMYCCRASR